MSKHKPAPTPEEAMAGLATLGFAEATVQAADEGVPLVVAVSPEQDRVANDPAHGVVVAAKQYAPTEVVDMVKVHSPRGFTLRIDHHQIVVIPAGPSYLERKHLDHYYVKAHKVVPMA
jgi:hypothetical protein